MFVWTECEYFKKCNTGAVNGCCGCAKYLKGNEKPAEAVGDGYEPSKLYWHEALDRSSLACDFFYDNVESHPAVQNDVELKILAEKITTAMADFYQGVGRKSYAFEMENRNA